MYCREIVCVAIFVEDEHERTDSFMESGFGMCDVAFLVVLHERAGTRGRNHAEGKWWGVIEIVASRQSVSTMHPRSDGVVEGPGLCETGGTGKRGRQAFTGAPLSPRE